MSIEIEAKLELAVNALKIIAEHAEYIDSQENENISVELIATRALTEIDKEQS